MTDTTAVYMCPQCGSSFMELDHGVIDAPTAKASCNACSWTGTESELLAAAFQHSMGSQTDLTQALINDLRIVLAKEFAPSFGVMLLKWGFLQTPVPPMLLGRYISAIAKAVLIAVLKERALIEREKANVS